MGREKQDCTESKDTASGQRKRNEGKTPLLAKDRKKKETEDNDAAKKMMPKEVQEREMVTTAGEKDHTTKQKALEREKKEREDNSAVHKEKTLLHGKERDENNAAKKNPVP